MIKLFFFDIEGLENKPIEFFNAKLVGNQGIFFISMLKLTNHDQGGFKLIVVKHVQKKCSDFLNGLIHSFNRIISDNK